MSCWIQLKNLNFHLSICTHYSFCYHYSSWCRAPLWLSSRTPLVTERLPWVLHVISFLDWKNPNFLSVEVLWNFVSWMREQTKSVHWHLLVLRFSPQKQALVINWSILLLIVGFQSLTKVQILPYICKLTLRIHLLHWPVIWNMQ